MKNSPEHALSKMYSGVGRTWKDISFSHTNTFGPNFIIPDHVFALTGNTTCKMKINSYILSQPTPNPVFDNMRVDVSVFVVPQRLYMRGIIGDNFQETAEIANFPIPTATLTRNNLPTDSNIYVPSAPASHSWTGDTYGYTSEVGAVSHALDADFMPFSAILPGSLLHRLGFPMMMIGRNFLRGIYDSNLTIGNNASLWRLYTGDLTTPLGRDSITFNMSTVCGYYDICRYYFSNLMNDMVPVANGVNYFGQVRVPTFSSYWFDEESAENVSNEKYTVSPYFRSLASFGDFINEVRGVISNPTSESSLTIRSWSTMFTGTTGLFPRLRFNGIDLLDYCQGSYPISSSGSTDNWRNIGTVLKNSMSVTGLWPTRYDSHFQTMYFDSSKVDSLMQIETGSNVESFRLAESEFATKLKRLLRGMRWRSWVDVTFGAKVKMDDHPIKISHDSYYLTFQDILQTAPGQNSERPLGSSAGRAVGGNKNALRQNDDDAKEIVFTTQEPCYVYVLYSVVPSVSYANVLPRHLTWTTIGEFPIPQYSGKQFESLKVSDLMFTGTNTDDFIIGSQPIYFDAMTTYNKVGGAFATDLKNGFVFKRDFAGYEITNERDVVDYLASTYVEPGVFDANFEDQGVNGRQVFNVKTYYDIKVCIPLENQVTDYNI